jgi:hypothetical protein
MKDTDNYSPEETARRRDAAIKRMIATPPTPHEPLGRDKKKRLIKKSKTKRA